MEGSSKVNDLTQETESEGIHTLAVVSEDWFEITESLISSYAQFPY